ncbi:MAG: T9SS type A sorting domain-containing protein [Chitinophagaceae bacterium]
MTKRYILLTLLLLSYSSVFSQLISSSNYIANTIAVLQDSTTDGYRSYEIRFEIQNDTLVLIDSFYSKQNLISNYLHSDFSNKIITIDYQFGGNSNSACDPNLNNSDSAFVYKYTFKLMSKDSLTKKIIKSKSLYYEVENNNGLLTTDLYYKPYSNFTTTSPYNTNNIPNCPDTNGNELPLYAIINDSLYIRLPNGYSYISSLYGTERINDSIYFISHYDTCEKYVFILGEFSTCIQINVADTASFDSLYVEVPGRQYMFYKQNGIITEVLNTILPIEGLHFMASRINEYQNVISWNDPIQEEFVSYEVMKNTDKKEYQVIQRIDIIQGEYDYKFLDIEDQNAYYKIRKYDINGKYTESEVIYVKSRLSTCSIGPNPIENHQIRLDNFPFGNYKMAWHTITGQLISQNEIAIENNHTIVETPNLKSGMYYLRINNEEIEVKEKMVIK